ncbi:MAG: M48 family metalloprotease [Sulfitobacter sp.]
MKKINAPVMCVLFLLILTGCFSPRSYESNNYKGFTSKTEERFIGQKLHPLLIKKFGGKHHNEKLSEYVDAVGQRIVANSKILDITFKFFVTDSSIVNAYSLPGGYIYINRGLLSLINTEDELAAMLSHEIAHVVARHYSDRSAYLMLSKDLSVKPSTDHSIIIEKTPSTGLKVELLLMHFARENEYQADRMALEYLVESGYNANSIYNLLKTVIKFKSLNSTIYGERYPNYTKNIMHSHPPLDMRISRLKKILGHYNNRPKRKNIGNYINQIDGLFLGKNKENKRISIAKITVEKGDTVETLSKLNNIIEKKESWFRVFNGMDSSDEVFIGQTVKLVI